MIFLPFDDSQQHVIPVVANATFSQSLLVYEGYRQGVEITNIKQLLNSTQAKMWPGYDPDGWVSSSLGFITNEIKFKTYGQKISYVDYEGTAIYTEKDKFNPTAFVAMGFFYPYPLTFDGGLPQSVECQIEPLTIPFKLPTNESQYYAHDLHGTLEDGNDIDTIIKSSTIIEQFIPFTTSSIAFWLDSGEVPSGSFGTTKIEGFISGLSYGLVPFDDTSNESIISSVSGVIAGDTTLQHALETLKVNYGNDLRPYNKKSAGAGFSYHYGNQFVQSAGTDSIAFAGLWRGK